MPTTLTFIFFFFVFYVKEIKTDYLIWESIHGIYIYDGLLIKISLYTNFTFYSDLSLLKWLLLLFFSSHKIINNYVIHIFNFITINHNRFKTTISKTKKSLIRNLEPLNILLKWYLSLIETTIRSTPFS